jgi:hypothetical protein
VDFHDAAGKRVGSVARHDVGKRAMLYVREGEWELRFGSGWRTEKVKVERGKSVTVEARKE